MRPGARGNGQQPTCPGRTRPAPAGPHRWFLASESSRRVAPRVLCRWRGVGQVSDRAAGPRLRNNASAVRRWDPQPQLSGATAHGRRQPRTAPDPRAGRSGTAAAATTRIPNASSPPAQLPLTEFLPGRTTSQHAFRWSPTKCPAGHPTGRHGPTRQQVCLPI